MTIREPLLKPVPIAELRPTQMTVGYREVAEKRRRWRAYDGEKKREFLGAHQIPTVLGPKKRHYVVDHHHLSRALLEEGVKDVLVTVIADLHHLEKDAFWTVCDHKSWVYTYDAEGVRRDFNDLPKAIADLADDPFRSLAGELRRAGGFAKDTTPFSEFLWADFLRRNIKEKRVENDFSDALEKAMALAKSKEAGYLPGWCGPSKG
ncbi:chromosome partitioning protein ParB [Methylobacterium sp. E-065]|uniref:ParB-like protein n=1 Tax=Methylobacterium sp. E-065 TaxID=2836583 RepID=UPI001FB98655|nr:ParB-like protein [Methylobacterium sp. E-065]MCJ2019269.1 chromosome partitioning protein ParB [Methylobacterium sp. E-065]